jgi:hypothetical protein
MAHRRAFIDDERHAVGFRHGTLGVTAGPGELNDDHGNRPHPRQRPGDAVPIQPQVYFNPILEAIGTPKRTRTRRLYQKTTERSRFGLAWIVCSSSRGGAMMTALPGRELDALWDDAQFVLSRLKWGTLIGALYLENRVASHVFMPSRIALLRLLASQAAISLENAHLYTQLRHAQACLAEAQRLSATGSFGWKRATCEIVWSDETYRIFAVDRTTKPTIEIVLSRAHPEDRAAIEQLIGRVTREVEDWNLEHRLLMPDGAVKHLHVVAQAVHDEVSGGIEYVGAVLDVTAAKEGGCDGVGRERPGVEATPRPGAPDAHAGDHGHDCHVPARLTAAAPYLMR